MGVLHDGVPGSGTGASKSFHQLIDGPQGTQLFRRQCGKVRIDLPQSRQDFDPLDAVNSQICFEVQIRSDRVAGVSGFLGDDVDHQLSETSPIFICWRRPSGNRLGGIGSEGSITTTEGAWEASP